MNRSLEFDNIAVFGLGYVGMTASICLAEVGFCVWGIDPDAHKVQSLLSGSIPLHEPNLQDLLEKNYSRLNFSTTPEQAIREL